MSMIKLKGESIDIVGRDHLRYRGVDLFRVFYPNLQEYKWHFGKNLVYHSKDLYLALNEIDNIIEKEGRVE